MSSEAERARIAARLQELWQDMARARRQERWSLYWALRRSWLAYGRLQTELALMAQEEHEAQLELLPHAEGVPHDRDPDAA